MAGWPHGWTEMTLELAVDKITVLDGVRSMGYMGSQKHTCTVYIHNLCSVWMTDQYVHRSYILKMANSATVTRNTTDAEVELGSNFGKAK